MSATIKPLGMLKSYIGDRKEVTVSSGRSVRVTLNDIGINPELVAGVFINGELETKDYVIKDGDVVKILAVIGGG
jgi:sulfur carrier protein ThiS